MSKPEFVYVIYIASTPEKVFQALTDEKMSEQYWVGNRVVSDWKIGAPFALKLKHEEKDVTGKVLEFDPPRRLAYSFRAAGPSDVGAGEGTGLSGASRAGAGLAVGEHDRRFVRP